MEAYNYMQIIGQFNYMINSGTGLVDYPLRGPSGSEPAGRFM